MGQALEQKNHVLHDSLQKSASDCPSLWLCKDTGFTGVLACVPKWQTQAREGREKYSETTRERHEKHTIQNSKGY